jgi:hypothetical protein
MARKSGRVQASTEHTLTCIQTHCGFCGHPIAVASVASRLHPFSGPELCPTDLARWRTMRSELDHRHETRRMQYRFRQSLEKFLATLEEKLSKERLPP